MTQLSYSSELDAITVALAAVIDTHAGDYPLVSFCRNPLGPIATWLYANLVIEVFIDEGAPASIRSRELGGVAVYVKNFQQGMELLRRTEGLRQKQDLPYIRLC